MPISKYSWAKDDPIIGSGGMLNMSWKIAIQNKNAKQKALPDEERDDESIKQLEFLKSLPLFPVWETTNRVT